MDDNEKGSVSMTDFGIPYIKMKVSMVPVAPASLPEWASSTVRGAFGNRILEAFCSDGQYDCPHCQKICSAGILYGNAQPDRSDEAINPYIIYCGKNSFNGEELNYDLTLFSEGVRTVDDVLAVLNAGLALGSGRTLFKLTGITDAVSDKVIFDGTSFFRPDVYNMEFEEEKAAKICIEFVTPYKTKLNNADFRFEQLVRAVLRRTSSVMRLSEIYPDFDYQGIIGRAARVNTKYRAFINENMTRYSNRAGAKMNFAGFTGVMICEGDLTEFMPLLRAAEILHAGKMCVMGLGNIRTYILEQGR